MIAAVLLVLTPAAAAWPTKAWPESTPQAQGMSPAPLEAFDRELASGKHGYVDSMLVIRNGKVVYDKSYDHSRDYQRLFSGKGAPGIYNYYDPGWHPRYKGTRLHTMQSVSKSVTSALIGIAIGRGEIPGVGVRVMPYYSAFRIAPDPRRDRMTLRDVLTMTAGIRWDEESTEYTDPSNNCAVMEGKDDWVRYVLEQPMAAEPGKTFVYNSGATQLLSYLIWKTTGRQADDYAKEHLFAPLGIESYWKRTPKGLADTEGGLYLSARDLAKIGYLYLKDGVWDGKRILPEGWARISTGPLVPTNEEPFRYGYQWWVLPRSEPRSQDTFIAWGYGGQLLIVVPDLALIAVFTGWNIYDRPSLDPRLALERVLGATEAQKRQEGAHEAIATLMANRERALSHMYGSCDMVTHMKTTVDIADGLLDEVRRVAAREGTTVRALIEAGLRREIDQRKRGRPFRLRRATFRGRGLRPELQGADWERIRDLAYEGRDR